MDCVWRGHCGLRVALLLIGMNYAYELNFDPFLTLAFQFDHQLFIVRGLIYPPSFVIDTQGCLKANAGNDRKARLVMLE